MRLGASKALAICPGRMHRAKVSVWEAVSCEPPHADRVRGLPPNGTRTVDLAAQRPITSWRGRRTGGKRVVLLSK
jgi:hypothetical protein